MSDPMKLRCPRCGDRIDMHEENRIVSLPAHGNCERQFMGKMFRAGDPPETYPVGPGGGGFKEVAPNVVEWETYPKPLKRCEAIIGFSKDGGKTFTNYQCGKMAHDGAHRLPQAFWDDRNKNGFDVGPSPGVYFNKRLELTDCIRLTEAN